MTLPQETIDRIEKEAEHHANVEWSEKAKHITLAQSINWENSKEDYQSGATEWAGKAKDLADAMQKVSNIISWMDGEDKHCQALREVVAPALTKYKQGNQ